jgi:hypothetical protein
MFLEWLGAPPVNRYLITRPIAIVPAAADAGPAQVPPHTPNSVSSGLRRANSRHSALHLTTGADGSCLVGQSPLTPSTEEEPVRLHDLKLGTRSQQHPVDVERRGRGGVVSLAKHLGTG